MHETVPDEYKPAVPLGLVQVNSVFPTVDHPRPALTNEVHEIQVRWVAMLAVFLYLFFSFFLFTSFFPFFFWVSLRFQVVVFQARGQCDPAPMAQHV